MTNTTTPRGRRRTTHNTDLDIKDTEVLQAGLDAQQTLNAAAELVTESDLEDLRRLIRNGERALGQFIDRHRGALWEMACTITSNVEDRVDLVAAGMSAIEEALAKWDPHGGASPMTLCWLVVKRRMRNRLDDLTRTMTGQPSELRFVRIDAVIGLEQPTVPGPELQILGAALVDDLRRLHHDLQCCGVEPTLDRPVCCGKFQRTLRKSTNYSLVRSWLEAA